MSFAQDFAAGSSLYNNIWQMSEDAKDRKRKQEWEDEQHGIIRKDRAALEEARTGSKKWLDEQTAQGDTFDTGLRFGQEPRRMAPGGMVDPQQAAQYNQENPAQAPQSLGLKRGGNFASDAAMYKSGIDGMSIGEMMQMRKELQNSRIGAERAAIESHILSASPEDRAKLLEQVSLDRGNKFKVTPDPRNPNLFNVTEGNEKVAMDATQLARFFGANHALKQGDHKAIEDIKALMPEFAARVKESYDRSKGEAENARGNFDSISADNARKAELGIRRSQAARQNQRDRMGAAQVFQDENGNLHTYMPTMGKNGLTWNKLALPEGMRPLKPAPTLTDQEKIGYQALTKRLETIPQDTPVAQVAELYRLHGLDPKKFGVADPVADIAAAIKARNPEQASAPAAKQDTALRVPYAQKAYQAWINSQPSYFQQETPTSRAASEAAYQEYVRALRDPKYNGPAN